MNEVIDNPSELRALFGKPGDLAVACMKPEMDEFHRKFIEMSPLVCMATSDKNGQPFVSPKGDAPGFVNVLDNHTLAIPDRVGNNKVETFSNIVDNPKVSLIFFVPGLPETLRVLGEASLTTDDRILALGKVGNSTPKVATKIDVTTVYFHCGKALVRSKFWDEASKARRGDFPSFGKVIKQQAALDISVDETEALVEDMYQNGLY